MNAVRDFERMRNAYPTRTAITDAYAEGHDDGVAEGREAMRDWYVQRLVVVSILSVAFGAGFGAITGMLLARAPL